MGIQKRKQEIYLLNTHAANGRTLVRELKKRSLNYVILHRGLRISKILLENVGSGVRRFFICGGDGTINRVINAYMKLKPEVRGKMVFGIVPAGRANDLARSLKIPLNPTKTLDYQKHLKKTTLDLAKVNALYFITGGGLGLPSEVAKAGNQEDKGKILSKIFGSNVYALHTIKKIVGGYREVEVKNASLPELRGRYMFVTISNQVCIGRRFKLSPKSIPNDGRLELCAFPKSSSRAGELATAYRVLRGTHTSHRSCVYEQIGKLNLELSHPAAFVADGEVLRPSKKYTIQVIPNAIPFLH